MSIPTIDKIEDAKSRAGIKIPIIRMATLDAMVIAKGVATSKANHVKIILSDSG